MSCSRPRTSKGVFVATEARKKPLSTKPVLESSCHHAKKLVSDCVAESVVDLLEAVEIDHQSTPARTAVSAAGKKADSRWSRKALRFGRPVR